MSTTTYYDCPTWCQRTDHDADLVDQQHPPRHYGPEFGDVMVDGTDGEVGVTICQEFGPSMTINSPFLAHRLRYLAADLSRAAEWLEANR